ncbi:MAG: ATP phosphoribosyltransferase [Ignavibacteria bacterium]|nr:ATP phosphoribosyltransferase [Ignavibacteria bacterium]
MTIQNNGNLKIAIQKKGRLTEKSLELFNLCGLRVENYGDRLVVATPGFPADILFLRDDDIPEYVQDGVADLGVIGENVLVEKEAQVVELENLGFGGCQLMMAYPEYMDIQLPQELNGKRIATSYPRIVKKYLQDNNIQAKVIEISGSVEIAPALGIADVICDIVSTGNTLMVNKLKKGQVIFKSQAVLIASPELEKDLRKTEILNDFLRRIRSVQAARSSKYLMLNLPKTAVDRTIGLIPALRSPTIVPLADDEMVAIHAVIPSDYIWEIVDKLKREGASGILLLPIENMIP